MLLLPVLIFLSNIGFYSSAPTCCQDPQYYADFLFTLKCGLSFCDSQIATYGNFCISCISKDTKLKKDYAVVTADTFKLSKPTQICQEMQMNNGSLSRHTILSWHWMSGFSLPSLFTVEARSLKKIGKWDLIGVTNVTHANVTNLEPGYQYQFRVTPLMPYKTEISPFMSDWFSLLELQQSISAPKNVTVSNFLLKENLVDAIVEWTAPNEIPCSYEINWSSGETKGGNMTIRLNSQDDLLGIASGLSFDTNYTLRVISLDPTGLLKVTPAEIWFVTPTCLNLTQGNFSICTPGVPRNVTVEWINNGTMVVSWMPPLYTSDTNPISTYSITLLEASGMKNHKDKGITYFVKDSCTTTIKGLKASSHYIVEVRALSVKGSGSPSVTDLNIKELSIISLPDPGIPLHYVVPAVVLSITFLVGLVASWYLRKPPKKIGYPSGLADVNDDTRTFLIPFQKIELKEQVGEGAFATVHRAIYTRNDKTKEDVAVKMFPSETVTRQQLLHELEVLRLLGRHNHIIQVIGFTFAIEKIYLVLEFCQLGNLHSYLRALKPKLMLVKSIPSSERPSITYEESYGKKLGSYIHQVAQAMEYISSLKLIHRDIAARNILMWSESVVKVGDFGLSKDIYETQLYCGSAQRRLPIKWMAPEAIENQKFTTFSDVWSFGVLMWEIFKLGKEPYPDMEARNVLSYLKLGLRLGQPHCTQGWYEIMSDCWKSDPRKRPRFKELVQRIGALIEQMNQYTTLE